MTKQFSIDVWSDIACPWCYVGKRRLESALAGFEHRAQVRLRWRSFQLDPAAPAVRTRAESYAQRLAHKYGTGVAQAQSMIQRLVDTAALEGIAMDFEHIRPGNTFDAHRLLQLAQQRNLQDALAERFMRSYFCEGGAIGESELLLRLASEVGLDADEVAGALADDSFSADVRRDQAEARRLGVDGVPFFLLGQRYAVAGAQPSSLLLEALDTTWQELPDVIAPAVASGGEVCGPEGCS